MTRALKLLGAALAALQATGNAQSPPVKISLRSSWPAPPLLAEILETVSLENPDTFFTFLDRLTDPEKQLATATTLTSEAIHQAALQIAIDNGILQESGSLSAVEMNLALHAATPKLEAFYNHYEDHHNHSLGTQCGSWVDWYGEIICDVESLAQFAGKEAIDPPKDSSKKQMQARPKILTFDHIYPPPDRVLERPPRTAIFYASLNSPNFRELHTYLLKLVSKSDPHVEYVFRHVPPQSRSNMRHYLSGYGVSLDLKKMDYLALDDRNLNADGGNAAGSSVEPKDQQQHLSPVLPLIVAHPENATAPDASIPLNEDEVAGLGAQAAQIIAESSDPLNVLSHLSQNFPKYATSLARRVIVNSSISDELHNNSLKAQRGMNMFWLNGSPIEAKDVHPFGLLRLLKKERAVIQSLTPYSLSNAQAFELLTHPAIAASQKDSAVVDALFDASDRPEGGDIIVWWNDMEKDSRYARWNPSLFALLRPMYPGAMPTVKANLFNIILILDLSQTSSMNFIGGPMANILNRDLPLRFGLVPVAETEEGKKMAKLFYYLIKQYGRKKTLGFLASLSQNQLPPHAQTPFVSWDAVSQSYDAIVETELQTNPDAVAPDLKSIVGGEVEATHIAPLEKIEAYTDRLGATLAASGLGHAFFNGKHFDMNDEFIRQLQIELGQQMNFLQEKVYEGSLSDETKGETMGTYFYDLPTTSKRRNRYIFPSNVAGLRIVNLHELFDKTGFRHSLSAASYIYPEDSNSVPHSLFIIADLDSEAGVNLIKEALLSIIPGSRTRLSFIHNPTSPSSYTSDKSPRSLTSWLFFHVHVRQHFHFGSPPTNPATLLAALGVETPVVAGDEGSTQTPLTQAEALAASIGDDVKPEKYADFVKASRLVARELGILPGQSALLVNGRIVGPLEPNDFRTADFTALEDYEYRKRTEPVVKALKEIASLNSDDKFWFSEAIAMASSVISSSQLPDPSESGLFDAPPRPRQSSYQLLDSKYTSFAFGDNSTAVYHIAVLVDPLSELAQKWSSILKWLSNVPGVFIEIHLNPGRYTEIPLKRFYRYNLIPAQSFDHEGNEVQAKAIFEDIPVDPIYTLAMDVPTAWLVRPREALYDLDNIQLGKLFPGDTSVDAVFDLDYLVVEGHARDASTNSAPRGVQLQLVTNDATPVDDTQIVANLGYFQFKAKPGVFQLEIRAGRGRQIFKLESAGNEGWDSPTVEEVGSEITVTSFEGLTLYPRLSRHTGMETADVLEEGREEEGKGLLEDISSRVMSIFKSSKKTTSTDLIPVKQQADINIFTVASGLLYERFVGIMILSVLRNTNSTVKFWFIENFLSPSFLEFIPHMAEKYNFQYELVTYKWPSWLRAQTEKQRIIWAYKILFLDVLFPMDLKKVIFVDADQIVRADLKELVDIDLQGAPYGYTPMGDDNTDMEGFRFWKTGYWKDFLRGKPYHISALYVIDLVRFRQLAAGDILRGQYQALSADPNSLANLDQDLPNNIQEQVPIFSLDEDWLWCETWCSKDRLHKAKTIDLCQNPLTKEPKLARARQIPEWEEYDAEIARLSRDLAAEGKIHSRMATADANVLAGAGTGGAANAESSQDQMVLETGKITDPELKEHKVDVVVEPKRDEL
ncbi:UDP-glucose:glycoprotein glucosyltransferase-domain-containing protein [Crassisporium funariophilum]|nr:UDP-glucose:glycoprotein glucosyltransferase-domain-containing protein [Crassisporium funariophilum]